MCFYDQIRFECGDHKWSHFRQHCNKEYRTGETCGLKLVMSVHDEPGKCRFCTKADIKLARIKKEEDRIKRWRQDQGRTASIKASLAVIAEIQHEITELENMKRDEEERWDGGGASMTLRDSASSPQNKVKDLNSLSMRKKDVDANDVDSIPPEGKVASNMETPRELNSSLEDVSATPSQSPAKSTLTTSSTASRTRLFPIIPEKDVDLISMWESQILPVIKPLLYIGDDTSISLSLLREGTSLEDSCPVVRIQTSRPRSAPQQAEIVEAINAVSPPTVPRAIFVVGSVRRTARRSDLDLPPCFPRNIEFVMRPPMGASIGIAGCEKDTAILGGYIYIDDIPHILTVHHLFVDNETGIVYGPETVITQPSLQEIAEARNQLQSDQGNNEELDERAIKKQRKGSDPGLSDLSFGSLTHSSGFRNRSRRDGLSNVEMDWALCTIGRNRIGSNMTPCGKHTCRDTSPVNPGAAVFSVGRTSGRQNGIINGCTTSLFIRDPDGLCRESDEWVIIKPESLSEETWTTSGIGVPGDSGAWILDPETNNVVGQLWGRDFQGSDDSSGQIITYFSPILDVFDDICEVTGSGQISLSVSEHDEDDDVEQRNAISRKTKSLNTSSKSDQHKSSPSSGVHSPRSSPGLMSSTWINTSVLDSTCEISCQVSRSSSRF